MVDGMSDALLSGRLWLAIIIPDDASAAILAMDNLSDVLDCKSIRGGISEETGSARDTQPLSIEIINANADFSDIMPVIKLVCEHPR